MCGRLLLTILTLPACHAFDASLSIDLALQVVNLMSPFQIFLEFCFLRLSLDIGHPEVWNCFSIDAMIKDKSSGYGWGHGMMYIDENPGYLGKVATDNDLLFSQSQKSEMLQMKRY